MKTKPFNPYEAPQETETFYLTREIDPEEALFKKVFRRTILFIFLTFIASKVVVGYLLIR